jgi:hypothetical protein
MGLMSEAVEDMKAMDELRKRERTEAWENRGPVLERIAGAGFAVRVLSEESRHCRIQIQGKGWFDFWPSTGRWCQSRRPGGRQGVSGYGVDTLLPALIEWRSS